MNLKNKLKDHSVLKLIEYCERELFLELDYIKNPDQNDTKALQRIRIKRTISESNNSKRYLSILYLKENSIE